MEESIFSYDKNNQLIKATDPKGKNFQFEYDNVKTDRILSAISSMGISNKIKYDAFGNPIFTKISKRNYDELSDGIYKIRGKGTDNYFKVKGTQLFIEADSCSNTTWNLSKIGDNFQIHDSTLPDYALSYVGNQIVLSDSDNNNLFTLEKNENGSYLIKTNTNQYLKATGSILELTDLVAGDPMFEFYFELLEEKFIENSATYSEDGRFVTSITDSNLNKTLYETNSTTGLTTSITDANGVTTNYTYNSKQQMTAVNTEDKTISYSYNDKNLLDKITQGTREYQFVYDDFLNMKKLMIGNNITLVTHEYLENNGNLSKTTYGNLHEILFDYDEFDRVKTIHKMDGDYHYKYDNHGNLAKILSSNHVIKYTYDIGKRIHEYRDNQFKINYGYDSNDNIINKKYQLNSTIHSIENTLNQDDLPTKTILDSQQITYQYDGLGRITNKKINDNYNITYDYISNGKRTSDLVKSIKNSGDKYSYQYDKLNNITHIYYNDELIKKYTYDVYNELLNVEDYEKNEKTIHLYDDFGNLSSKIVKDLTTGSIIKTDTYQYGNNNWVDQLTNYNGNSITYDPIGNPLTIGNYITLNWINGRSLNSYVDTSKNLNISYQYNKDGIRTSKIINGVETKYFLEGNRIIYEQRGNDFIYYLYDREGLIGFHYNGLIYYYIKNIQGDIIGILNSNYEQIVSYEYDSWGNLLSVKDDLENNITSSTHVGIINPFRYRGYYYDTEIELYYLNSRYYNPTWGRFLNADGIIGANQDLLSYNLYAYCSNNPVSSMDDDGDLAIALPFVVPTLSEIIKGVALALAVTLMGYGSKLDSVTSTKTQKDNNTQDSNDSDHEHNVYVLKDGQGIIQYVGRTKHLRDTEFRHLNNPARANLELQPVAKNISKETARGLEQMLIMNCRTLNRNKEFPINNQINGLSPYHKLRNLYWDAALIWSSENELPCQ